jgi:hypothetical protein
MVFNSLVFLVFFAVVYGLYRFCRTAARTS